MSDKKMSGKQAVAGGFDLNSFVNGAETPENIASEAPDSPSKLPKAKKRVDPLEEKETSLQVSTEPRRPKRENLSVRLQIRITQAEFEKLEKEAGLIPHSTFLRKLLQDNGIL
jgi:hypothetical protein